MNNHEKRQKRPTLTDMKEATGLSVATISRAINGKGYVSKENLETVKKAQKELNYYPRKPAPKSTAPPKTILLSLPNNYSQFWLDYLKGIQDVCRQEGYYPLLVYSEINENEEVNIIKALERMQVAGLVVVTINASPLLCEVLQASLIPRVLCAVHAIESNDGRYTFDCISVDSRRGISMATMHLAENGCKNIAYIGIKTTTVNGQARLSGYFDALKQLNFPVRDEYIRLMEDWECEENGYKSIYAFHAANNLPDGVVALNDRAAVGALLACNELRIKVPDQIKLIGMDNTDMNNYVTPTLSSVDIAPFDLAVTSAKMLFNRIHLRGGLSQNTVLTPKLVIRQSSVLK